MASTFQETFPAEGVTFDIAVKLSFREGPKIIYPYREEDYHLLTGVCRDHLQTIKKIFFDCGRISITNLKQSSHETTFTVHSDSFGHFVHFTSALDTQEFMATFRNYILNQTDFCKQMNLEKGHVHLVRITFTVSNAVKEWDFMTMSRSSQRQLVWVQEGDSSSMQISDAVKKSADDNMDPQSCSPLGIDSPEAKPADDNMDTQSCSPLGTGSPEANSTRPIGGIHNTTTRTVERQANKERSMGKYDKVVQCTFAVYVGELQPNETFITFSGVPGYTKLQMIESRRHKGIWKTNETVCISEKIWDTKYMSYQYTVKIPGKILWFIPKTVKLTELSHRSLKDMGNEDIFNTLLLSDLHKMDHDKFDVDGKFAFMISAMNSPQCSVKTAWGHILSHHHLEGITVGRRVTNLAQMIDKFVESKQLSTKSDELASVMTLLIIGFVSSNHRSAQKDCVTRHLKAETCSALFQNYCKLQSKDFPYDILNIITFVLSPVALRAIGPHGSLFDAIHHLYPNVDISEVMQYLKSYSYAKEPEYKRVRVLEMFLAERDDDQKLWIDLVQTASNMDDIATALKDIELLERKPIKVSEKVKDAARLKLSHLAADALQRATVADVECFTGLCEMTTKYLRDSNDFRVRLENHLIECISAYTHPKTHLDVMKLQGFLCGKLVFVHELQQVKLFRSLLNRNNETFHGLCRTLLKDPKFGNLPQKDFAEIALQWFEREIGFISHGQLTTNNLAHVYTSLHDVCLWTAVSKMPNVREKLRTKVFGSLRSINLSEVLKDLNTFAEVPADVLKVFEQDLLRCIDMQCRHTDAPKNLIKVLIQSVKGRSSFGPEILSLITAACSQILDHVQTPTFDDPAQLAKAYKQTFKSIELWKMLFESPRQLGVMDHQKIRLMWDQLCKRTEALVDKTMSPCESKILTHSLKQYGSNDPCMFLNCFVPSADIKSAVKDAKCLLKQALTRFEMLNRFFQLFILEMAKEVPIKDLPFHQGYLKDRQTFMTQSTNATLKLIEEGGDFPKLAWLLDKVENLTTLSASQIFLQICRKNIVDCRAELQVEDKREEADDQLTLSALFADEDDRSEITTAEEGITMETLLEIVQKKCVPEYEHRFNPFKEDKDMPLSVIDAIFKKFDISKEMKTAKDYLKLDISNTVNTALEHFKIAPEYHRRASEMRTILGVFGIENDDGPLLSSLKDIEKCQVDQNVTLRALSTSMTRLLRVCKSIDESSWEIMRQLSLSQQLVDYLRDKKDQDFRNLIDAVEEHSEQCLKESEVNDFIEVQQFARPLVNGKFSRVEQFFETFQQCRKCGVGNVAKKIESCRYHLYSLKALIRGVGNREELTHEIISNARQRGKFKFSLPKRGTIQLTLTYKLKKGKRVERHMDEVKDLRSRALLLSSSGKHRSDHHVHKTSRNAYSVDDLQHFVDEVDMALRVCGILQELNKSGHFQFRHFEKAVLVSSREELSQLHQSLHDTLEQWILTLEASRKENYLLNFVHCDRLSDILSFFVDHKLSPETMGLLHFIDPRSKPDTHHPPPNVLCTEEIGSKLDYIAMHLKLMPNIDVEQPCRKKITVDQNQSQLTTGTSRQLQSMVSPGDLYLAVLDPKSKDVLPVVLELYWNTTGFFPTAHELLLCRADTTWEDIQLLLARYLYAPTPLLDHGLYCLANIETLSSDVTRKLIEELSNILHILQSASDLPDYHRKRLAVVCRGEDHHPFIDHFSDKAHRISGMSENAVRECITSLCPEVEIVTSDLPGMGKTEYIHTKATTSPAVLGVKTLRIGGPVSRKDLVQRLASLRLSERHFLHLDVTEIDGSFNLDEFIFELLVIGSVSSGSYYYQSPTQHVCIEVANAIHNAVLDSLMTARWFQRQDLKWDDYDSLIVSDEVTSSVQVVCHFLNAMSSDTLDEEDIEFSGPDKVQALAPWQCKHLLKSYFRGDTMSYSLVEIFLNALASQLRKFSHSYYFKTASLRDMVGQSSTVRNTLVQEMVAVFEDFSKRSVAACRSGQVQVTKLDSTSGSSSVCHHLLKSGAAAFTRGWIGAIFGELSGVGACVAVVSSGSGMCCFFSVTVFSGRCWGCVLSGVWGSGGF